jgi:tetratricopeptide (TPR) repeat protein
MMYRSVRAWDCILAVGTMVVTTLVLPAGAAQTTNISTKPSIQSATEPVTEPVTQPSIKPATQPTARPATRPTTQPATQPAVLPATGPVEPILDPAAVLLRNATDLETHAYSTQKESDYQAAVDAMEKYLAVKPDDVKMLRSTGFLWLDKLNNAERAYPHLDKAYSLSPEQSDWAITLAVAAGQLGKSDRQIEVLRQVLKREPDNKDAKAALADAMTTSGATTQSATQPAPPPPPTEAEKQLEAAFDLETRAYTTDQKEDYQAAADALEQCSKVDPKNVKVQRSVGFLWLDKLKDPAKAFPHLEKAYELSPDDAGWGSLLAKAAGETDRGARQLEVLADVVKRNPDNANAHLEFAQGLDKSGQHDRAGKEFLIAMKLAPQDEGVQTAYAQFLHTRGRDIEAKSLADQVLAKNPKSSAALTLQGDIHRADWDLDDAQAAYQQALAQDPESELARTGINEIRRSRAVTLDTSYYYFKGSDHYMQQGLYNTLSLSTSSHIFENATYNMGYFKDNKTKYPSVIRYQEGIGIEDRVDSTVSIRGGLGAFQMPRKEACGFNLGVTWKPTNQLWIDATYRTEDPVNDSMYTVAQGLSQDILGFTGGYQYNDDLALKFAASRSSYSDDVTREFIHIEPNYTIWQTGRLKIAAEYETVRYSRQLPGDGGTSWYQTFGPVVELEPPITSWLSLHARAEFPYVPSARQWGSNLSFDIKYHPGDHLELKAGVFYVSVPESISSYSGSGVDASVTYRF